MKGRTARWMSAALLLATSLCAFAESPNLCTEKEDPVFACPLENKKLVSACALVDPTQKSGYGYLVYRYGTKEKIELSFPGKPMDFPRVTSAIELVDDKTAEDDQLLRFRNGKISYVVYTASSYKFDLEGVAVFDGYKLLSNIKCQPNSADVELQENFMESIGAQLQDKDEALRFLKPILPDSSVIASQKSSNTAGK